ncbi:MAG: hypothetical protein HXX08_22780 [Chloroflexi bacterium]|uniref:Uncharacterized protein n=1 Tax=Candidatus Chlorohelix allophototropha TaxID=3003348 RepID=A0A8T7M9J0_9CHLR|nr:hypothetical protein [Chloroflexota bacterium]WJW68627.1 hypothetical protein OZ401_004241 [Chloroflexota bacterium L227-S17]
MNTPQLELNPGVSNHAPTAYTPKGYAPNGVCPNPPPRKSHENHRISQAQSSYFVAYRHLHSSK